ncbi:hypothetical protein AB1Y20_006523 [Prymnesium parvum]|uniref:Sulfotransferase n=1 Tax=Prymnesium parvum TaxID=97485 RepID=A0AB34IXY5_PRYPA
MAISMAIVTIVLSLGSWSPPPPPPLSNPPPLHPTGRRSSLASWEAFVRRAYDRIYRPFRSRCHADAPALECLEAMYAATEEADAPWWLRTMLRDARHAHAAILHGAWHSLASRRPTGSAVCTIEKVGTTNFRRFMALLQADGARGARGCSARPFASIHSVLAPEEGVAYTGRRRGHDEMIGALHGREGWSTFVFLREPLERFASGFEDKCRRNPAERHCSPLEIFGNGSRSRALRSHTSLRGQLAAYADTFPLSWNLHFFPQALFCDDLGRNLHRYSFVGRMNETFLQQMRHVAAHIDHCASSQAGASDAAMRAYRCVFPVKQDGHATHAKRHVSRMISAFSARRLLEIFSIDYVELELPLPSFLEELPF